MQLDKIRDEMQWSILADDAYKDILVVVHNQYEYVKNCLESVFKNTENFRLHVWDNGSQKATASLLEDYASEGKITLYRQESNLGFIIPNNRMAALCKSDWMILLNSDTEVFSNWDKVLIGALMANKEAAQSGFGGILDKNIKGKGLFAAGFEVDYILGYCFCISRETHHQFGLFDEANISFAYCEDSDFSLRLRESGKKLYGCYASGLVRHYGSKTTMDVLSSNPELLEAARKNQKYMLERWSELPK